jgi:hypothetical protein
VNKWRLQARPAQLLLGSGVFCRHTRSGIQCRLQVRRQHSVPRGTANRTRFRFQTNFCSTARTKSCHMFLLHTCCFPLDEPRNCEDSNTTAQFPRRRTSSRRHATAMLPHHKPVIPEESWACGKLGEKCPSRPYREKIFGGPFKPSFGLSGVVADSNPPHCVISAIGFPAGVSTF